MTHNHTLSRTRQRRRIRVVPNQRSEAERATPGGAQRGRAAESAACVQNEAPAKRLQSHDELLRPLQAAILLNVTPRCLQAWRLKGTGPRFIRMTPKLVQYRRSDLEKFIEESAA